MALPGYEIDEPYATGASGVTWRGHSEAGETVLIRYLRAPLPAHVQERLRLITRLEHPSLVNVRQVVELPTRVAVVWDYVEGTSLTALLGDEAALSTRHRHRIAVDVARAMGRLH